MAYHLTLLGISVLSLLRAHPMHGCEMLPTLLERHVDRMVSASTRGFAGSLRAGQTRLSHADEVKI